MARFIKTKDNKVINIQYVQNLVINPEDDKELIIYKSNGDKIIETYDSSSDAESAYNEYKTKMTESGGGGEPTGTIQITTNGTHDVKSYASAEVSVQPNLQSKSITISENTTTNISADSGYDGLSSVSVTTQVPSGGSSFKVVNGMRFTDSTLTEFPDLDTSEVTDMNLMFNNCSNLVITPNMNDTSNVTIFTKAFYNNTHIETARSIDTSSATKMDDMFSGCSSLVNVPVYSLASMPSWSSNNPILAMFYNCPNLSNDSLNNILAMCATGSQIVRAQKTLRLLGLSSAQATTCTGLSNWASAQTAGWSTGY